MRVRIILGRCGAGCTLGGIIAGIPASALSATIVGLPPAAE
jgi:hypothetical protein